MLAGAFAAHALARAWTRGMLVGVQHRRHLSHDHALALGLAALACAGPARRRADIAAALFLAGIILFSGSLYLLALTGMPVLGFVTPIGGMAFIAGWVMLALAGAEAGAAMKKLACC